jgi:hypothetical protein
MVHTLQSLLNMTLGQVAVRILIPEPNTGLPIVGKTRHRFDVPQAYGNALQL